MESSNLNTLYAQLLHWYKETDGQLPWEQAPHYGEFYNGLLAKFFRYHDRSIKKYRIAHDGETTIIGSKEEAQETIDKAISDLFRCIEHGTPKQDPIAFVEKKSWDYFVEMHPTAAHPEFWSPDFEKLRKKMINWLTRKFSASEADAEEVVDASFLAVMGRVNDGMTFKSLKAYLTITISNAFLALQKNTKREIPSDPQPTNPADDLEDDSNISNEDDALWQSGYPAPDEILGEATDLSSAIDIVMNKMNFINRRALKELHLFNDNFTDNDSTYFKASEKYELIAEKLGITPNTFKVQVSEGKKAFKEGLAELGYRFVEIKKEKNGKTETARIFFSKKRP